VKITGKLLQMTPARDVRLAAFPMEGGRFGLGVFVVDVWGGLREFYPAQFSMTDAAALFPGMTAAGRTYDHLVIAKIER